MEPVRGQYASGHEMADYNGMEVHEYNEYQGMEAHAYHGNSSDDGEKRVFGAGGQVYEEDPRQRLRRDLKTRQISMIALGGALGTGLLITTGPTLADSGPVSMLIGYGLVGVLCFTMMCAMGEMAAWLPIASGFTGFAHRFVDPALGFALGWNYWFKYIITTPNNLIAFALVVRSWLKTAQGYDGHGSSPAIYIALVLVVIITINYYGVAFFGEFEFWLSSVKVLIMICLVIFTCCLACGVGKKQHPTGFHYWVHPGAFAPYRGIDNDGGKFLGFWNVLSNAVFSFLGAELVGVTVGEAQNPRKAIPKAVRLTFFRIVFFYLVLIFFLGLTVPYNSPFLLSADNESKKGVNPQASPFIVAATIAGLESFNIAINIFLLIFTFSAANSDLYIATRTMYSLALEGNAPKIFARTNDRGVPIYALGISSAMCGIAFVSADTKAGVFETFTRFANLVTIFGILTWISILISHIYFVRARKEQNVPDTALAYVSPFGIRGSMIALVFACVITFFNGFSTFITDPVSGDTFKSDGWKDFICAYIGVFIYAGMYFGYKVIMKSEVIAPGDADLFSGKARIDEEEAEFVAEESRKRGAGGEKMLSKIWRLTLGNCF